MESNQGQTKLRLRGEEMKDGKEVKMGCEWMAEA